MSRRNLALAAIALALIAASLPGALQRVAGGAWAVSRSARGTDSVAVCVSNPAILTQWEHRGRICRSTTLLQTPGEAIVDYTCAGGEFGRTRLTMITPRTVRLETQGIHLGEPFGYIYHARRLGSCAR
jgi:hypothetical protein